MFLGCNFDLREQNYRVKAAVDKTAYKSVNTINRVQCNNKSWEEIVSSTKQKLYSSPSTPEVSPISYTPVSSQQMFSNKAASKKISSILIKIILGIMWLLFLIISIIINTIWLITLKRIKIGKSMF